VTVAGLLLAAGAGRRIGGPKALLELEGTTLVERGIALLRAGGCEPVLVVVGACADDVAGLVTDANVVVAIDWAEGLGASLRTGLAYLQQTPATACLIALVDQPLVGVDAVRRLVAVNGKSPAAVATYGGKARNPVLLDRSIWADVATTAIGDVGARGWLHAHPDQVLEVACDGTGSPEDIDTAADLAALVSRQEGGTARRG
jgi:CTP:molybdopterin cytidylyltransferase MocA